MSDSSTAVIGTFPRGFSQDHPPVWPLVRADSLVELRYGRSLTESARRPGQVPVYGTNGRCGWHDEWLTTGPGVILGRKGMGNLGVEWCTSPFWVIDTAYYAAPVTPQLDLHYFYYLVSYIGLNHLKDGTSNPSLSRDTFGAQLLPVPPLDTQQAIAASLSEIDDKIEQNRRTGRAMEGLARATFKAWFVDFEPVKAEAAGFPGMPDAAFAALPNRLTDSTIGQVPQGWKVQTVGDVTTLSKQQINPQEHGDELFEHFSIPAYDAGQNPVVEPGSGIMSQKLVVVPGCVLLSKLNPRIPRVWIPAPANGRRQIASTEFLVAVPKPEWTREFLYCLFQQEEFRDSLAQSASGTSNSHQRVRPSDLLTRAFVAPPKAILAAFTDQVVPQIALREALQAESSKLAALRDYLLPRLLSGRATVRRSQN